VPLSQGRFAKGNLAALARFPFDKIAKASAFALNRW